MSAIHINKIKAAYKGSTAYSAAYVGAIKVFPTEPVTDYDIIDYIDNYTGSKEWVWVTSEEKWYRRNNLSKYELYGVYADSIETAGEVNYVSYATMAATSCFDTGLATTNSRRYVMDIISAPTGRTNGEALFGSQSGWQTNTIHIVILANGHIRLDTNKTFTELSGYTLEDGVHYKIDVRTYGGNRCLYLLDGDTDEVLYSYSSTFSTSSLSSSYHIFFGNLNSAGSPLDDGVRFSEIKEMQVYSITSTADTGTLTNDFVVLDNGQFYDKVSSSVVSSISGSATYAPTEETVVLRNTVDGLYINKGYIDTGIALKSTTKIHTKLIMNNVDVSSSQMLYGGYSGATVIGAWISSGAFFNSNWGRAFIMESGVTYDIEHSSDGFYLNGEKLQDGWTMGSSSANIYINSASLNGTGYTGAQTTYLEFQIYDGDTLELDLVPAMGTSAGFKDTLTGTMYYPTDTSTASIVQVETGATTYEGKLAVSDNIEYQYSGGSWVSLGEMISTDWTIANTGWTAGATLVGQDGYSTNSTSLCTLTYTAPTDGCSAWIFTEGESDSWTYTAKTVAYRNNTLLATLNGLVSIKALTYPLKDIKAGDVIKITGQVQKTSYSCKATVSPIKSYVKTYVDKPAPTTA